MLLTWVTAAAWAVALGAGLHFALGRKAAGWLSACFASAFLYVVLSLQLEHISAGRWLQGLRWGLLAVALFAAVRYRLTRRS